MTTLVEARQRAVARDVNADWRGATARTATAAADDTRDACLETALDEQRASALWRAIAGGLWSIEQHFDLDGRRHFVVRKNAPNRVHARALSPREEQVARAVARGDSNKVIACDLGISISSVAIHWKAARKRLRLAATPIVLSLLAGVKMSCDDQRL